MAIDATYRAIKTSQYIQDQLSRGISISAVDVVQQLEALLATLDLTQPQFTAEDHHVTARGPSSASAFIATFEAIRADLLALYQETTFLSDQAITDFERWNLEVKAIEKKLVDLEDRIEDLLLLTQDTEGYHSIIIENFTDKNLTDLTNTTAFVDLKADLLALKPSNTSPTRVFLNELEENDITFSVRSSKDFVGRTDATKSSLVNIFKQQSDTWWTNISMKRPVPVVTELIVRLSKTGPVDISKVFVDFHDSAQSSPISITPLYSTDNINFFQLPTNTFTQEVRTKAAFSFSKISAQYMKFIFVKRGPDPGTNAAFFNYQVGFKEISFFHEGFTADATQSYISRPLSVVDRDGSTLEFEKLTIEACEKIDTGTKAKFSVITDTDSSVPFDSNTIWSPLSPSNRSNPEYDVILDIGDTTEVVIGDDEVLDLSFDPTVTGVFANPAQEFTLVSGVASSGVQTYAVTATDSRFTFVNPGERILSYQLDSSVEYPPNSLELFRNIGEQGLSPVDSTAKVRGVQKGWAFSDPWYTCVVEVENNQGATFDFGARPLILDGVNASGDVTIPKGIHRVQVHKDNWFPVVSGNSTLQALKNADPLYPHNHKLLVEGYPYPDTWTDEKKYTGVDLFAEEKMKKVSPFDLYYNTEVDNYRLFAMDLDAPDTHTGGNEPTTVLVVKIDEEQPDFQNERFVLRFSLTNQLRTHLRVKIDLTTESNEVTPVVDAYKIKLG